MLLRYTNHAYATAIASCGYAIGGLALAVPLAWMFGGLGVAVAFTTTEILAVGLFPPLMVGARFRFGAFRHLLNSYFAGALAFLVSYVPAQFLFAVGKADLAGIVLRLALWAGIVIPLGVALALPRTRRRQLFADIRRRLTPAGLLSMK
jgi:O-antigen/teichoic acid export membrane protein